MASAFGQGPWEVHLVKQLATSRSKLPTPDVPFVIAFLHPVGLAGLAGAIDSLSKSNFIRPTEFPGQTVHDLLAWLSFS